MSKKSENEDTLAKHLGTLRALIKKHAVAQGKIEELESLAARLESEIEAEVDGVDPADGKAVNALMVKQGQLDALPREMTKLGKVLQAVKEELREEHETVRPFLADIFARDRERLEGLITDALRPFTGPDDNLPRVMHGLSAVRAFGSRRNQFLNALQGVKFAQAVIDLAAELEREGSLLPKEFRA